MTRRERTLWSFMLALDLAAALTVVIVAVAYAQGPTKLVTERDEIDGWIKFVLELAGVTVALWQIAKRILAPAIEKGLRALFREQLEALAQAAKDAKMCCESLRELAPMVRDNRDWLEDLSLFVDVAIGIDRRGRTADLSDTGERRAQLRDLHETIVERRRRRRSDTDEGDPS